jgi:nitrogen fixation NifU-like protein
MGVGRNGATWSACRSSGDTGNRKLETGSWLQYPASSIDLPDSSIQIPDSALASLPYSRYTSRRVNVEGERSNVDRQARIDFILDHYENPRHYGPLPDATIIQKGGNPGCGDVVTFYLEVDNDRIRQISYEGDGCTISQAASSIVTELFTGKTLADVEATPSDAILDLLGREIAGTRLKCATLGLNTTKEAIRALRRAQGADSK